MSKTAIIIGAGPAGLTAAYELVTKTEIKPIILEASSGVGGISRTVEYKGNRMDIGGHRFFSKSDVVMEWWQNIMPVQGSSTNEDVIKSVSYHQKSTNIKLSKEGPNPDETENVMLIRNRLSRIYFLKKFFDYPISLNLNTIKNLGIFRIVKIGFSYLKIKVFPVRNVRTLEDFFISRFGNELYRTFFKDYTEKVWGVECSKIDSEWGAQRIKSLSITKAIVHALKPKRKLKREDIRQKDTETSLIEQFMYPKYGPGQMWDIVLQIILDRGGVIVKNAIVEEIFTDCNTINAVEYVDFISKKRKVLKGDYFISTMPVKNLITGLGAAVPFEVKRVSEGLQYRDFITVGLLLTKLKIKNSSKTLSKNDLVPDNWIYIQERDVKLGRLQIFNNWSPYMVANPDTVWIGLEYFCNESDELWKMSDESFIKFAIEELEHIQIIDSKDVLDSTIVRVPKTYPAYFGTYSEFDCIKNFTNSFENLFLVGRNGMHKYNNQDHSMLTAITAVNNIINNVITKDNIWTINTEEEYHESK